MPKWRSCFRHDLFVGKVALVSGGGTGIGKTIATELAFTGATVIIVSRNASKCEEAARDINALLDTANENISTTTTTTTRVAGRVFAGPSTNIRNEEQVKNVISFVVKRYGSLDILINNAGGQFICLAEDMSQRGFAAVVETNLTGTFLMCREAHAQYMSDHGGSIVNITLGNRNGMPNMVHSGAARAGIENMTATLCSEWMESDVRINCVRPGIVWTESGFENYGPAGDSFVERLLPALPARRFASPEEVSSAVVWLASEGASYVTGAVVCVDGGGSFHFLPLIDIEESCHLPVYGTLPRKAKL